MVEKNEPVDRFAYNRWIDRVLLLGEDGETPISDTNRIPISASLEVSDIDIGDVNLLNIAKAQINPATEDKQDNIITYISPKTDLEGGGKVSVGTTPVEVTFTGSTKSIVITADKDNTGLLYIGKSNITNLGANAMTFLESGDSITLSYNDTTNGIFIVSDTVSQNFWKGALL